MKPEPVEFTIQLPADLVLLLDKRAADQKIDRDAWIARALGYVLTQLPAGATPNQRRQARQDAKDNKI